MDYIQKLPFILGSLTAIIAGLISYGTGTKQQEIYIRMAIFLTLFFALGLFVRHSILKIQNEIEEKKNRTNKSRGVKEEKGIRS